MKKRATIATMRRWRISWKNVLKCVLRIHGKPSWNGCCPRCGWPKGVLIG